MSPEQPPTTAVVWTDPQRIDTTLAIIQAIQNSVKTLAIGTPSTTNIPNKSIPPNTPITDDPRQLLVEYPADFLLLHSNQRIKPTDINDALQSGTSILAVEPFSSSIDDYAQIDALTSGLQPPTDTALSPQEPQNNTPGKLYWAHAFESTQGWARAADPQAVIGPAHALSFQSVGPPDTCSLAARLFDGWRSILKLGTIPDVIDACITAGLPQNTDKLSAITGNLTAHARMPDATSAVMFISDQTKNRSRSLQAIGPTGSVLITDHGYALTAQDSVQENHGQIHDNQTTLAEVVVRRWLQILDNRETTVPPQNSRHILACCLASVLSTRTGQPESPAKMLALTMT